MADAMARAPAIAVNGRRRRSVEAVVMAALIALRETAHKPQIMITDVTG
jgi:hypothetical protein